MRKKIALKNTTASSRAGHKELTPDAISGILRHHDAKRENLIPMLQELQNAQGFVSPHVVEAAAKYLDISENEIYGVASFYTQFRFTRPGEHMIKVCLGTACHVRGGERIKSEFGKLLGIGPGETTPDHKFSLERVACFGSCALSPVVVIDDTVYGRMSPKKAGELLKELH